MKTKQYDFFIKFQKCSGEDFIVRVSEITMIESLGNITILYLKRYDTSLKVKNKFNEIESLLNVVFDIPDETLNEEKNMNNIVISYSKDKQSFIKNPV